MQFTNLYYTSTQEIYHGVTNSMDIRTSTVLYLKFALAFKKYYTVFTFKLSKELRWSTINVKFDEENNPLKTVTGKEDIFKTNYRVPRWIKRRVE